MDHEPEPQKSAVSRKRSSSRTATRMSKRVKQVETESDEPPTKEVTPDKDFGPQEESKRQLNYDDLTDSDDELIQEILAE